MIFPKALAPLWIAAALAGCASPSFQACMLAAACSSITTQAATLQVPQQPIRSLCVARLIEPLAMPVKIMAAGPGLTQISEGHKQAASKNVGQVVKLYADHAPGAVLDVLKARGVHASLCDASTSADTPRLYSRLEGVTTDTGGAGWRTQVDISASLSMQSDSSPVWRGTFRTGNRLAVTSPDVDNVKSYADNLSDELAKSGWLPR